MAVPKLVSEWPGIAAAPLTFFLTIIAALVFLVPAIWIAVSWGKDAIADSKLAAKDTEIASKKGQIEILERRIAEYQEKLKVGSPDEAKARIEALERQIVQLGGLAPRSLIAAQRSAIEASVRDGEGRIMIHYYRHCYDCADYARQLSEAIGGRKRAVSIGDYSGGEVQTRTGLLIGTADTRKPSPAAMILADALTAAKLEYSFIQDHPTQSVPYDATLFVLPR